MEGWQINNITKNLPELLSWTKCNTQLLAKLQAGNVLGEDDIQAIKCEKKPNCKAEMLYDILRTRRNAYYILAKAVIETKQTGAAELLLEIPTKKISELQVLFMGTRNSVKKLLNPDQIKSIQSWLQENASLEERLQIHKSVLDQKAPLKLLLDTIPDPDPLYIPRLLICRQAVNPNVFQQECPDVFVFTNASQMELRKFITSYGIEYSSRELLQREIRVRFLILDVETNWNKICSKVNSPVHLIRYEKEIEKFLLEETSGDSNILREYLEHNEEYKETTISSHVHENNDKFGSWNSLCSGSEDTDASDSDNESEVNYGSRQVKNTMLAGKSEDDGDNVGIFEDIFVKNMLTKNVKCIGICDLPGMGKSYLLASLARMINAECPDRIVAFIQLQNFKLSDNTCSNVPENAQLQLIAQLATSKISKCILMELLKCKTVKFELFFDGLDEVQETNLEPLLVFFQTLVKHVSETRIFVTSRPVLQTKLQKALRVIAYDIKPFNTETQIRYLVTQWKQAEPDTEVAKLEEYARFCLKSIGKFLKNKKRNITGIPLQCKLIADVYIRDAGVYANKNCKIPIELPHNFPTSLFEIYTKFIRRQLGSGNCDFACFYKNDALEALCTEECQIRNFHVLQALRLIFPHLAILLEEYVSKNFDDLSIHKYLTPGILKKTQQAPNFEFVHRTYAEYLVADYFWKGVWLNSNDSLAKIQSAFVKYMDIFVNNEGLAYFLDCMITDSQKNVNVLPRCTASTSPVSREYVSFLMECIESNYTGLLELCLKATKNHKLNGKTRPVRSSWLSGNPNCSRPTLEWEDLDGKYISLWLSNKNAVRLLFLAAANCSATTFDKIYNFFLEVLQIDMYDLVWSTLMDTAIYRADFELVHYFSKKMSLEKHGLLYKCLGDTYFDTIELVEKKLDIAKNLLAKCPSLLSETYTDFINREYKTPIHAWRIHLELLKFLVRRGCDIMVPNCYGYSIVYLAADYMCDDDFFELCRFMCFECKARDYFLDPANWVNYVWKFKHWVEKRPTKSLFRILCNLEIETVFVQNNPFLDMPNVYEKHMKVFVSLIYSAFREGKLDFAKLILSLDSKLLQHDVYRNVNLHDTDTLHFITTTREKLFVSKESNVFAVSSKGETILHMAARTRDCRFFHAILCMLGELWDETQDIKSLKASISHGAISGKAAPENLLELFNWHENMVSETPLHYAVQYLKDLSPETMDILLSCGTNYQAKANEFTLVDINAVNKYGVNALIYALNCNQRFELVRHLVNRGADWTIKHRDGCNITHICAKKGLVDCLKYFVELGSDVNQPDNQGNNALQCAMQETWGWIIQVLIDAGVDKAHKNKEGKSAYDLALQNKYPTEILKML